LKTIVQELQAFTTEDGSNPALTIELVGKQTTVTTDGFITMIYNATDAPYEAVPITAGREKIAAFRATATTTSTSALVTATSSLSIEVVVQTTITIPIEGKFLDEACPNRSVRGAVHYAVSTDKQAY